MKTCAHHEREKTKWQPGRDKFHLGEFVWATLASDYTKTVCESMPSRFRCWCTGAPSSVPSVRQQRTSICRYTAGRFADANQNNQQMYTEWSQRQRSLHMLSNPDRQLDYRNILCVQGFHLHVAKLANTDSSTAFDAMRQHQQSHHCTAAHRLCIKLSGSTYSGRFRVPYKYQLRPLTG